MTDAAEGVASPGPTSAPDRLNPYVGPRAFRVGETIYGRSHEIAELRDVLIARRIVLLYSPSGAGKSSLIEAGLRAELTEGGFVLFPTIRVGSEPPPDLAEDAIHNRYVLSTVLSLEEGRPPVRQLPHVELATIDLASYLDRLLADDGARAEPCLIFDQFEELFTLDPTDVEAKRAFLTELGFALRDRGRWALFAMREDFIAQLDPYLGLLPTRLASRYRLDLLDPATAKLAVQQPAREQGVAFGDAAADRLIDDLRRVRVQRGAVAADELGPSVEPVQLQVVCRQLWSTLDPDASSIEVDDVVALGNVDDALADFYVDQIAAVAERTGVSEREIRRWFDEQLITTDGFRTQVLEGPGAAGPAVLRELENAHLIRADELLPVDREYLAASRAEQRRVDLERKVSRRNRVLAVVATGVGLLALGALGYTASLKAAADSQRAKARAALAQQQVAEAERKRLNSSNSWLAAGTQADMPRLQLLAWQAAFAAHPDEPSPDLRRKLTTAQHYLAHDPVYIASASALDPSGGTVARGAADGRVEIVDVETLQRRPVTNVGQPVEAISFSSTGDVLAVAAGRSVSFWEGKNKSAVLTAPELSEGHGVADLSLADGANGLVAAVVYDAATGNYGRLVVWDQGVQITAPVGPDVRVARVVLGGDHLAVIAKDPAGQSTLRVWRRSPSGWEEEVLEPAFVPPAMKPYAALSFSADGSRLAAGTVNGLNIFSLVGPGGAPPSQPADSSEDATGLAVVAAAFSTASADAVRTIDASGRVVDWRLLSSGQWQSDNRPDLIPSIHARMDADGGRVLLDTGGSFTVADTSSGSRYIGRLAVTRGSTSGGRSVVVQRSGVVDEQASSTAPWSRGTGSGTVAAALSPDGQKLATIGAATGAVRIATPDGAAAEHATCPDTATTAQQPAAATSEAVTVAVADNAVVAATADLPADPGSPDVGGSSSWCLLPTDGPPATQPAMVGEHLGAVRVGADGQLFVVGTELNGGGTVDVYSVETGELLLPGGTQTMTSPVTAVALGSGSTPLVAAGDEHGNLLAFQMGSSDAETGRGTEIRCDVPLPMTEPVVAVSVGPGSDGEYLAAASTRNGVFVYRISLAAKPCATLFGGFDLLRDEGEVVDLTFDAEGRLTALESDFNVFNFDPLTQPNEVAGDVAHRAGERGWTLTEDDCQRLLGEPRCPT